MKKILLSLVAIVAVAGGAAGVTIAFYNDTETSAGNILVASSVDLKVDHTKQAYNDHECVGNCEEIGSNLVLNGGFETPDVPTGGWAIYPDASQTSWTVESGSGLEIQDHAAGDPHGGNQLGELDSYNSSAISQIIPTVAGNAYQLRFWYSPRPNRPAGDNTIGAIVQVVSNNALLVNDIIGAGAVGGSNTSWTEYAYNFVAVDGSTKIKFSDLGTNNSYGGYLDDISLVGTGRVNAVSYHIRQKPKGQSDDPRAPVQHPQVTDGPDGTFVCPTGSHEMPLLCPYLSKHETTGDGTA